jgi:SAM-dependent methyltransferase
VAGLAELLADHCARLRGGDSGRFVALHEEFVLRLAAWAVDSNEDVASDTLAREAELLREYQRRYLSLREAELTRLLLALPAGAAFPAHGEFPTAFGSASYGRVGDLVRLVNLTTCRRAVVIGCGAFPATVLWLRDHQPSLACVGVDVDPTTVTLAKALAERFSLADLTFLEADGCAFDYAGFDFVYVANQVTPKSRALERIAATADRDVQVVVRNPYGLGWLLAECVRNRLPERFQISAEGSRSPGFLSVDLVLSSRS